MLGLLCPPENGVLQSSAAMIKNPAEYRPAKPRQAIAFTRRTVHGARAVGSFLPSLTTKALQKYGFSAASLILDWPAIVGPELAQHAAPERMKWPRHVEPADDDESSRPARRSGATLMLRVDSAKALDVQYRSQQIVERINAYFGYAAVAHLRIIQAPLPNLPPKREARARAEPLTREVAGVADTGLRDALARLGAEIRLGR
jgi:hypothetical protein